jgi:hypothetical protein
VLFAITQSAWHGRPAGPDWTDHVKLSFYNTFSIESRMHVIQLVVTVLVILMLAGLLIDGALTRAVWVKGARNGLFSFRHWAHKCERDEEAWPYWFAMGFYALVLICLCALLMLELT